MPAEQLFPFPLFSHVDIPIPSHSHSRSPYINDYMYMYAPAVFLMLSVTIIFTFFLIINGNSYSTILYKSQHYCFSNTNPRHYFNTIHHCVTEDKNKSHYVPLCESRKQRAQSVA